MPALTATLLSAATQIDVDVPPGDPWWTTAVVAVGAALLGSIVGGYASFRANEALELSRRRARAQVRRKAKIYTPIRAELMALLQTWDAGRHLGVWQILREPTPHLEGRGASLHLWKDLVEDGRAMTATSKKVRELLDQVDSCADALNREVKQAYKAFAERGSIVMATLGREITVRNWADMDTRKLLRERFVDLSILGGDPFEAGREADPDFRSTWSSDPVVAARTADVRRVETAFRHAIDDAMTELDRAMRSIADKYEHESPED